jgi:hypothetical protein
MTALAPVVAFWREFDLDNKWRSKLDEVRRGRHDAREATSVQSSSFSLAALYRQPAPV